MARTRDPVVGQIGGSLYDNAPGTPAPGIMSLAALDALIPGVVPPRPQPPPPAPPAPPPGPAVQPPAFSFYPPGGYGNPPSAPAPASPVPTSGGATPRGPASATTPLPPTAPARGANPVLSTEPQPPLPPRPPPGLQTPVPLPPIRPSGDIPLGGRLPTAGTASPTNPVAGGAPQGIEHVQGPNWLRSLFLAGQPPPTGMSAMLNRGAPYGGMGQGGGQN